MKIEFKQQSIEFDDDLGDTTWAELLEEYLKALKCAGYYFDQEKLEEVVSNELGIG